MKKKINNFKINKTKQKTSVGNNKNSRPTNKRKRKSWKRSRGQGKG